ncbi:hypothetical protein ACHAWC_006489 [Mediolabrus comicus]
MSSNSPLPASAGDIDPSDIRQGPLSSDELRQIRSLIDVTTSSSTSTTSCQPLAGRRVMVPLTSKAFLEGELQPPIQDSGSASSNSNAAADEVVFVNMGDGGKLKEMTRVEACALLDKQQHDSHTNNTRKAKSKNMAFKKGFLNGTTKSKVNVRESTCKDEAQLNQDKLSSQEEDEAMFPLMEIREECDVGGNIVNSEVINMSNTMKRIDNRLKNSGDLGDDDKDGEALGNLLANTLKESDADIATKVDDLNSEEKQTSNDNDLTMKQMGAVSDEDYEAILHRLEELERLEEEDTKSKKLNKASSKSLQSSGWSKGFLNSSHKQSGTKKVQIRKEDVKIIPSTQPHQSEVPALQVKSNQKVSFSSKTEIKEIPRVGTNRVPPRPISATATTTSSDASADLNPFTPISTIPFEDNVFRGVVKERASIERTNEQPTQDAGGKKKLSRFAQQRLQRES